MNKNIKQALAYLPLILYALFLIVILLPYYSNGKIISGGEGSYFLDFLELLKTYGYSWIDYGTGIYSLALHFGYIFHLAFLQVLLPDERKINFVMIFSIYFLPFLAMYTLSLKLKLTPIIAFIISLFYLANPFMINFLKSINQWNMLAAYILPAYTYLILKYYEKRLVLFTVFGLHSLLFAFTNANPPTMVIYQIGLIAVVAVIVLVKENKLHLKYFLRIYLPIIFSFVLFNLWWILNWFSIFFDVNESYSKEFAISILRGSGKFIPALWQTINLTGLLGYPPEKDYDFTTAYFAYWFSPLFLSIPIIILLFYLLKKKFDRKVDSILLVFLLITGFFVKGVNGIFGEGYEFLIYHLPLFSIFKSAGEKWGLLFVFFLTLLFICIFQRFEKKNPFWKGIASLLILYIAYNIYPYLTSRFIPDYHFDNIVTGSRKFTDKKEYQKLRTDFIQDPIEYRILSLPGSLNYQIAMRMVDNKFYTGNDPILNNSGRAFIAPYNGTFTDRYGGLFDSISHPGYFKLLGIYNIGKIIVNKDMYPWFGFRENETFQEMEKIFSRKLPIQKIGNLNIYNVLNPYFLPLIYAPEKIVFSPDNNQNQLIDIVSTQNNPKEAYYFTPDSYKNSLPDNENVMKNTSEIVLEGEIQSYFDEAKLKEGTKGVNPNGVLFPYVRWKPSSFIYPFIEKKEEKNIKLYQGNDEQTFNQHLFFAAKRISEIQKWETELNDQEYLDILNKYQKEMNDAVDMLRLQLDSNKNIFSWVINIEVALNAHQKRITDVLYGHYIDNDNSRMKLTTSIFDKINNKLRDNLIRHYSPTKYKFRIPEDGEYEIYSEKKIVKDNWQVENSLKNSANKFKHPLLPQPVDQYWVSFGKQFFSKGDILMQFSKSSELFSLSDQWTNLNKRTNFQNDQRFTKLKSFYAVSQTIPNWKPNMDYKISFQYRGQNSLTKILIIEDNYKSYDPTRWETIKPHSMALNDNLGAYKNWKKYEIITKSNPDAKTATFYIYSAIDGKGKPSIEYSNISFEEIIDPNIVLRKIKDNKPKATPQVSFTRINPTKYIVSIKNATSPYFLIFGNTFHYNWNAYPLLGNHSISANTNSKNETQELSSQLFYPGIFETIGKTPLPEDRHILMNGYANSWYITPKDAANLKDYQIIIEYYPQRLFYIGLIVTIVTGIISLVLLVFNQVKKHV